MTNKNLQTFGTILMILAAVVLLGLFSHWTFAIWRIVDWAVIAACGYIGYNLYSQNK